MRNIFVALLLIQISCGEPDHEALSQALIQRRVSEKINTFIAKEKEKCRNDLLIEASAAADSTLRANPILIQIDSLQKPPKPIKPPNPSFSRPKDTIRIEPIL
jgi:hypothetical protein